VHTNKWAALAKLLKGRTDNAIKNHWNATLSRKLNNPAENFRNQYIERNVTLEWLLQHPELDSSNDIEEALAGTFKSNKVCRVCKGLKGRVFLLQLLASGDCLHTSTAELGGSGVCHDAAA
jgi:hypothetical protein